MIKTERKLKSKGLIRQTPSVRVKIPYDRHYVAKYSTGVENVAFSRGSICDWDRRWEANKRTNIYLRRWFEKQAGRDLEDVFHEFSRMGWKNSRTMYYYWDSFVNPGYTNPWRHLGK